LEGWEEAEMTGATAAHIDLQGGPMTAGSLKAMSDCELEEQLTVTAAAPGNRLTPIFGQLLGERDARSGFEDTRRG
jgi:hypothetical protein